MKVKVSLETQVLYVMEEDRALLVAPVSVGKPGHATPKGRFRAYNRIVRKRSGSYGFHVKGSEIRGGNREDTPSGWRYVGYPMPYWVEFKPGYGIHAGWVWPVPRTHGCVRIHPDVAPRFFSLVRQGTPIHIADNHSEDATLGRRIPRPRDYLDPDPPRAHMISDRVFTNFDGR